MKRVLKIAIALLLTAPSFIAYGHGSIIAKVERRVEVGGK